MFSVLSLKEPDLHNDLNSLSMNWEQFAVRISRQLLAKNVESCPPWQADLPGLAWAGESSTVAARVGPHPGRLWNATLVFQWQPQLQISVLRLPIKAALPLANVSTQRTCVHACLHTRTHACLVGKLLLAVWRPEGCSDVLTHRWCSQ